ncbi:MAG: mechanosensitive ion channel family protein [Polyangiales bacterium]
MKLIARRELSWIGCQLVALGSLFVRTAYSQPKSEEHELADALEDTTERIDLVGDKLAQLGDRVVELLPLLGVALVTIGIFWVIARLLTRGDWLFRWIDNRFARDTARHLARIVLIGCGVLLALELLDATALFGAALGAAGVVGIAVGFAFRDILENYLAGLLLSMRHPFEPNDLVSIDGDEGKVVRLTSRATVLLTLAGNHLRIPNSKVFKAVLVNYTRNPVRRLDFEVNIGVDQEVTAAQKVGVDALASMDAILDEPPPIGLLERLGDSTIPIHFFAWVDQDDTDYFKALSEAIRVVKAAFDDAAIEMPEPIYQVRVTQDRGLPSTPVIRPSVESMEPGDTAPDVRLDAQVESERAAEGPDLLDDEAPKE